MKNNYVYIEHMGSCPGRALDARRFEQYFFVNDFKLSKDASKAHWILFITCAYKKNIEELAIMRIKELSQHKGNLIIGGCLKGVNQKKLSKNFNGESFVASNNEYIDKLFPDFKVKFRDLTDANILYPEPLFRKFRRICNSNLNIKLSLSFFKRCIIFMKEKSPFFRTYYIRICWGCIDSHCTYCRIWRATGRLRSKPINACLREFYNAIKSGYRNIILVGENIGAYGLDIGKTLPDLLSKFITTTGNYEMQLDCLNPMWIIKYIDKLASILKSGKIKVINCPIQSGNSRILKLMNRGYTSFQLKESLIKLKKTCPELKLYTHIIVGFPSETEQEFNDTITIIKAIGFDSVQIYPFSKNEDMLAEYLQWEIPDQTIKNRLEKTTKYFREYGIAYFID